MVQMDPHWELYIEAKDGLYSNHDLLEVVHRGHVIDRLYEHKDKAPGLIVDLMRSLTKQYGLRPSKEPNNVRAPEVRLLGHPPSP